MLLQNTVIGFFCCFSTSKPYLDFLQYLTLLTISQVELEKSVGSFPNTELRGLPFVASFQSSCCVIRTEIWMSNVLFAGNWICNEETFSWNKMGFLALLVPEICIWKAFEYSPWLVYRKMKPRSHHWDLPLKLGEFPLHTFKTGTPLQDDWVRLHVSHEADSSRGSSWYWLSITGSGRFDGLLKAATYRCQRTHWSVSSQSVLILKRVCQWLSLSVLLWFSSKENVQELSEKET